MNAYEFVTSPVLVKGNYGGVTRKNKMYSFNILKAVKTTTLRTLQSSALE